MSSPDHREPRPAEPYPAEPYPAGPRPDSAAAPAPAPAPAPVDRAAEERRLTADRQEQERRRDGAFPVATGPRTTGAGGHVVGFLVGLVLTILAGFLVVLGQSRILAEGVGATDVSPETLGIVLVTLGALVAGVVVLLGLWTPAAPLAGGLAALLVGAAYLFAPVETHRETLRVFATEQNRTAVLNSITVMNAGGLFATGVVLLAAATAFSLARRRGVELGAFRERRKRALES